MTTENKTLTADSKVEPALDEVVAEPPKHETIKRFRANAEAKVSDDYFLYSCLEFERTYPANAHFPRYTGRPSVGGNFQEFLRQMLQFYKQTYPVTGSPAIVMNHQNLEDLLPAVTSMLRDFEELHQAAFEKPVPKYILGTQESMTFWSEIETNINSVFPSFGSYVFKYLRWSYGHYEEEFFEIGSRPPVGRYMPSYRMRNGGAAPPPRDGRPSRGGSSGGDRGGSRGPRRDSAPPPRSDRGGSDQGSGDRGPRPDRGGPPPRRSEGSRDRGRPEQGQGNADEQAERTQRLEGEALKEVAAAIRSLKENPDQKEYPLRAANSFYRRIQHQTVVQNGYHSRSAGEGNDRKVIVTRDGQGEGEGDDA